MLADKNAFKNLVKYKEFEVADLGTIRIRSLSAVELIKIRAEDFDTSSLNMVSKSIVDENGANLFQSIDELQSLPFEQYSVIIDEVIKHNNLAKKKDN